MPNARILVVEDEYIVAKDIQSTLIAAGYGVPAVVSSGEEAIRKVEETHADLVLMDIELSGAMDGVEAAEEISSRFNVPVVYLTGNANGPTLHRAKISAPYGYILKPFDEAELHPAIEVALHKHEVESQREVTERRRADEELRQREERFRRIFEHSNDAILVIDPARDEILDVNPKACDMLGYSREELLSLSVSAIHPNDMAKLMNFAQSVFEQGHGWTDELGCITKAGEARPAEISASMVDLHGKLCMVAIVRDITERKKAEGELRESHRQLEQRVRELNALHAVVRDHLKRCQEASQHDQNRTSL